MREAFDTVCAFVGALALIQIVGALLLVALGDSGPQEGIVVVLFTWASIEAVGQVRKFVGC